MGGRVMSFEGHASATAHGPTTGLRISVTAPGTSDAIRRIGGYAALASHSQAWRTDLLPSPQFHHTSSGYGEGGTRQAYLSRSITPRTPAMASGVGHSYPSSSYYPPSPPYMVAWEPRLALNSGYAYSSNLPTSPHAVSPPTPPHASTTHYAVNSDTLTPFHGQTSQPPSPDPKTRPGFVPPCMPGAPIVTQREGQLLTTGPEGANLFCFYLPNDLTNAGLYNLFAQFGPILSVRVIIDKKTGRTRGFGFVSYEHPSSAEAAIKAMNGYQIGNKRLKVVHKMTKEQKEHQQHLQHVKQQRPPLLAHPYAGAVPARFAEHEDAFAPYHHHHHLTSHQATPLSVSSFLDDKIADHDFNALDHGLSVYDTGGPNGCTPLGAKPMMKPPRRGRAK